MLLLAVLVRRQSTSGECHPNVPQKGIGRESKPLLAAETVSPGDQKLIAELSRVLDENYIREAPKWKEQVRTAVETLKGMTAVVAEAVNQIQHINQEQIEAWTFTTGYASLTILAFRSVFISHPCLHGRQRSQGLVKRLRSFF